MRSFFFYTFIIAAPAAVIIAALAAAPAFATGDGGASSSAGAAPVSKLKQNDDQMPEAPPAESRMQIPDTPHQLHTAPPKDDKKANDAVPAKPAEEKPAEEKPAEEKPAEAKPAESKPGTEQLAAIPTFIVALTPSPAIEKGREAAFTLALSDKDGKAVSPDGLEERHGRMIDLLAADESFTDYQHVHAETMHDKWMFSITPKTAHNYNLWVEVKPKDAAPQLIRVPLKGKDPCKGSCADKTAVLTQAFGKNDKAKLVFDGALMAGKPAQGTLELTGADGKPLKDLEAFNGVYADIAVFSADGGQLFHVYPDGAEPKKQDAASASPLTFTVRPAQPGVLKIFAQVRRNDKDMVLPFTASVAAPPPPASSK